MFVDSYLQKIEKTKGEIISENIRKIMEVNEDWGQSGMESALAMVFPGQVEELKREIFADEVSGAGEDSSYGTSSNNGEVSVQKRSKSCEGGADTMNAIKSTG